MGDPVKLIAAVQQLLPGFITAWLVYKLTKFPKKSTFEHIVLALILTTFIQAVVLIIGFILIKLGDWIVEIGKWNSDVSFVVSVFVAIILGLYAAKTTNKGPASGLHKKLHDWGITKTTPYPSGWYSAFYENRTYIWIHLKNGRMLYGWPTEWPEQVEDAEVSSDDREL